MNDPVPQPVDLWNSRLPDGGPMYTETDLERLIREPWNAVTAFFFVVLVGWWLWRIRGNFRQHLFLLCCMPILLAGGVGGTIYHALRRYYFAFLLDVIPIGLLVVIGSAYLLVRLRPKWWHIVILALLVSVFPLLFVFHVESHMAIVIHYVVLALLILVPVAVVMVRTQFRYPNLIMMSLVCFGFAILFRFLDPVMGPILPMGSHWLWHLGGAVSTAVLAEYFYRIETEPIAPLPWQLAARADATTSTSQPVPARAK